MSRINRVLFLGSKSMGLKLLREMHQLDSESLIGVITIDDRKDTRSEHDAFRTFASETAVRFFVAKTRKESEDLVRGLRPDLCIVNGWYWLFEVGVLNSVPRGFLGVHNSLLPKYRGGSPLVWAMINGEKVTGTTLFSLAQGIDDGDIWAQESVMIENTDYVSDVLLKLENKAVMIFREKYLDILEGKLEAVPQQHDEATYCASRLPSDGLIDWNKPAASVYNFIRAQSYPYPGAFTYHEGHQLTIWRARPESMIYYGTPRQVARVDDRGAHVICGDNKPILLEEATFEGHRQPANRLIRSVKIRFSDTSMKTQFMRILEDHDIVERIGQITKQGQRRRSK